MNTIDTIYLDISLKKILEMNGVDFKKYTKMLTVRKGKKIKKVKLGDRK